MFKIIALCRCTIKGVNIIAPRWLPKDIQRQLCYCGCNVLEFDATYDENLGWTRIHDYCPKLGEVELKTRVDECKDILKGTNLEVYFEFYIFFINSLEKC